MLPLLAHCIEVSAAVPVSHEHSHTLASKAKGIKYFHFGSK